MDEMHPSTNLQMEILALLVFYDKEAKYIRSAVELKLYDSKPVQELARDIYDFIDNFQSAPKEHFAEIVGKYLNGKDRELYEQIYSRIGRLRTGINASYVLAQLDEFLSSQHIQLNILGAYDAVQKKDIEAARKYMYAGAKSSASFSDPGLFLSMSKSLLYQPDAQQEFTSGIQQLDERRFTPARGNLMLLMGLSGKGKTWWLVHIGAKNAKLGKKILHISLENNTKQVATRYVQNLMFLTRANGMPLSYYQLTEGPTREYLVDRMHKLAKGLYDPEVINGIDAKLQLLNNIVIKFWAPNTVTMPMLTTYLDMLEQSQGFMPDELLIDRPELFHLPKSDERRIVIGDIMTDLRKLAIDRNMAVVAPVQSNRSGKGRAILTESEIAEDFSQYMTADMVASINVTDEERRIGLARAYVLKNRDDVDRYCVILNQALEAGQFSLNSVDYHEKAYQQFLVQYGDTAAMDD